MQREHKTLFVVGKVGCSDWNSRLEIEMIVLVNCSVGCVKGQDMLCSSNAKKKKEQVLLLLLLLQLLLMWIQLATLLDHHQSCKGFILFNGGTEISIGLLFSIVV